VSVSIALLSKLHLESLLINVPLLIVILTSDSIVVFDRG